MPGTDTRLNGFRALATNLPSRIQIHQPRLPGTSYPGLGFQNVFKAGDRDMLLRDVIRRKLSVPNAERIFFIRHALRAGFTIEEIFNLTKIDRWFLLQIKEIVDFEEELAASALRANSS